MSDEIIRGSFEQWLPEVGRLYKTLGDVTRLKILTLLLKEELNVTQICEALELEQSVISHQLRVLRKNHMVTNRREGKAVYYSLEDQHVRKILLETFTHVSHVQKEE